MRGVTFLLFALPFDVVVLRYPSCKSIYSELLRKLLYSAVGLQNGKRPVALLRALCLGEERDSVEPQLMIISIPTGDCLVAHRKIGCFADKHGAAARVRPVTELLFSERRNAGPRHSNGFVIDWDNWDTYLPALACRCAQAAKRKGYKIFSLEFYGRYYKGRTYLGQVGQRTLSLLRNITGTPGR